MIEIFELTKKDTIHLANRIYGIERLSPLINIIGNYVNGDSLTVSEMMNQQGINGIENHAKYHDFDAHPKYFKCLIIRDSKVISLIENYGNRFNNNIIKSFSLLQKGDEVYFLDLTYSIDNNYEGGPQSVKLIIK